jgi:NADH:ubiquinone oxidoreductase subunit 2 (subunit N)
MKKISRNTIAHIVLFIPLLACLVTFAYRQITINYQNNCSQNYPRDLYIAYILSIIVVLILMLNDVSKWSQKHRFKQVGPLVLSVLSILATIIVVSAGSIILFLIAVNIHPCLPG